MDHFKAVHPLKYYQEFLVHKVRPDGRGIDRFRNVAVNISSIETCNGSAIVRIGNTSVVCGVKAELGPPKAEQPEKGILLVNVELPPLCSSQFRPGPPNHKAQVLNAFVNDVLNQSGIIDLKTLCIETDKLVWSLYCDIFCLNYDGSVADACFASLVAALSATILPKVEFNRDTCIISVDETVQSSLNLIHEPIATTFLIVDENTILVDPCNEEECLSRGTFCIVISKNEICAVHKPGGIPISESHMNKCISDAKNHATLISELIDTALTKR